MKKTLTKQELTKLLKENYFLGCFYSISEHKNQTQKYSLFIINFPYGSLYFRYSTSGWNYLYYGETHYTFSKKINELIEKLDQEYKPKGSKENE